MGGETSLKMEFGPPFTIRYRRVGIYIYIDIRIIYINKWKEKIPIEERLKNRAVVRVKYITGIGMRKEEDMKQL